ncbi:unnamed protein product [Rotaria magnacalcarata]|uniref:EGF-like domain-containing protein n=1 Tax=Rotaria magnacalcarata TaxID=392030 RepID=A0A8S3HY64_9BILA|nr:unnamed protein product [Rotaria magnacalcarata]CAF5189607.1 unnamed protein product [Rotaria magnacalcarata]
MDIDVSDLYSNSFVPIKLVFHLINRESFETVDSTQHSMVSNQTRNSSDTCKPGWIGTECSYPDLICRPNPCFPGSIIQTTHICHEKTCQNNGRCLTPDVNARAALNQFECACPVGFIGFECEKETARLNIHFESKIIAKDRYIPLTIVRLIYIYQYIQSNDSYRRLLKNVQLENPLPIFHRTRELHQFHFAFIQLAIERNRCPCIDPSFNEKIVNLVSL